MDLEGIEKDKKSGIQKIKSHAAHKLQGVTNKTSDLLKIPPQSTSTTFSKPCNQHAKYLRSGSWARSYQSSKTREILYKQGRSATYPA